MKSKIFSSDYVKTTSKGQMWIPSFLALGFFMAFPVAELLMLGSWTGAEYTAARVDVLYEALWRKGFVETGFIVICAAALLNGVNNFWYLYSARKVDFYHCLPVKRTHMFWHRTYVGILNYLLPYLATEFIAICIGAMRGHFNLKLMGMAVQMMILHFVLYLLVYFAVVLAICLTGNILMGVLALLAFFLYGPVLGLLVSLYRELFFCTSYMAVKGWGLVGFLIDYCSPFFLGKTLLEKYAQGTYGKTFVIVIAVTAVLGALAFAAYVRRPSEKTCKPVIYHWVGVLVKFLIVVPCGLGVGLIFYVLPGDRGRTGWWIFGMALGTVLFHGIIEVLYQLDFRKFFSKKLQLALAGILVAACAVCYHQDIFRFDGTLPEKEKIQTLNLNFWQLGNTGLNNYIEKTEHGTYLTSLEWDYEKMALNQAEGLGDRTYQALESIVAHQKKRGFTEDRSTQSDSDEGYLYRIPVKYKLTSGREIYRQYRITEEEIYELTYALYSEGSLKEKQESFLMIDDQYLKSVSGYFYDGNDYTLFQDDMKKNKELLEALRQDMQEADVQELMGMPCANLTFSYRIPEEVEIFKGIQGGQTLNNWQTEVSVYPSFERTVAILKETGYPMSMEEVDLKSVEITYYSSTGESAIVSYESREELDDLKKAIVPYRMCSAWIKKQSDIDLMLQVEDGWGETYAYLLKEKTPDFVTETMKEAEAGNLSGLSGEQEAEDSVNGENIWVE
ncbi:MAG: DUF6449 domain-containing protein [Eubacteriales bacterium]|nr:DUF6449 domain-containing protein [Eubacteriales bacterium]